MGEVTMEWGNYPFQPRQWFVDLDETIADTYYIQSQGNLAEKPLPKPGALRWEEQMRGVGAYSDVQCSGLCCFRWGLNRHGGTISAYELGRRRANQAITADVVGTVSTFVDTGQFTVDEETFGLLHILNDADVAGGAPEGEWAEIVKNTANILYLQPDLTLATAVGDTGIIYYPSQATQAAAGVERQESLGWALVDVADNYWGWWLVRGVGTIKVKAATAIAANIGLISDASGCLTVSAGGVSGQDIMLARSIVNVSADIVSDTMMAFADVLWGTPFTSA